MQDADEFLAGFRRSGLRRYRIKSNIIVEVQRFLEISDLECPVSCAVWITNELWVGVGSSIAVIDSDGGYKLSKMKAVLSDSLSVSAICAHGDRVWVTAGHDLSSVVVELDTSWQCVVCSLDCSLMSPSSLDDCIAVFRSNQPNVDKQSHLHVVAEADLSRKLSRKLSYRRTMRQCANNSPMKNAPKVYVSAVAFVDGLLWIGLSTLDIVLVNATQDNCFGFSYGQVVARLGPTANDLFAVSWGPVREIISTGRHVITLHEKDRGSGWSLIQWLPVGLEDIHRYRSVW